MTALLSALTARNEMHADLRRQTAGVICPGLTAIGLVLVFFTEAWDWPWQVYALALLLIFLSLIVLAVLQRTYLLAVWLLVLGSTGIDLLALLWFPSSASLYVLAIPSSIAALVGGPIGGIATAMLSSLLVLATANRVASPPASLLLPVLFTIWGTTALAGVSSFFTEQTTESLWVSYTRMQRLLEEARDQRLELKQTQEDLVQANAELARLSERLSLMYQVAEDARHAKEEFVANVSHELRTPLNMIVGFGEMISESPSAYGTDLPTALLADVDVILRNARHLASLVDDVLDLSQVEASQMAISKEWTCLQEIVDGALVAVRPLFEAKNLTLSLDMPHDLPVIHCDRTRIRQVILNLVSNAARFTDRGGVRLQVQRQETHVVVSVTDSGPGIAPENQGRIFEPFQQVDASIRRRFGGTGLGLSISKRFVEMHNGRMWLESEIDKGSTFYFTLPIVEDPAPLTATATRWLSAYHQDFIRTRPSKAPKPTPQPRFLIVEQGNMLQRLLTRHYMDGVDVVAWPSLEEAVAELKRSPAQALIVNDPAVGQASSALIRQAPTLPYGTPVVACWVPGEKEAAARLGVVKYLLKPVSVEALRSAIVGLGNQVQSVLLADDDPEVLQLFGRMLNTAGGRYRLLRASGGRRALDLLRERRPDALLLDLVMPGMDGYEVLREKSLDPEIRDIPVIAVSAVDPTHGSLMSNSLTLMRSGGLSLRDLLSCLHILSEAMTPPGGAHNRGH